MKLTKPQLRELQPHRGHLDTDSGMVFTTFIGEKGDDGCWHGECQFSEPGETPVPSFRFSDIVEAVPSLILPTDTPVGYDSSSGVDDPEPSEAVDGDTSNDPGSA
jgi:hypothetical protein